MAQVKARAWWGRSGAAVSQALWCRALLLLGSLLLTDFEAELITAHAKSKGGERGRGGGMEVAIKVQ